MGFLFVCFERRFEGGNTLLVTAHMLRKSATASLSFEAISPSYELQNAHFSTRQPAACFPHTKGPTDVCSSVILESSTLAKRCRAHFD